MLDEREAVDSARSIISGVTDGEPWFKAPGYSWIMAAIMSLSGEAWPWTVRAVQHLAGAWVVGMVAWLAGLLSPAGGRRKVAIAVAGFLGAVYAPLIRLENNLSLDFWAVFFQSAMLCALAALTARFRSRPRSREAAYAGCLAAAAWLVRPTITVALPFLALWLVIISFNPAQKKSHRILRPAIIFLLPIIFAATAVTMRNFTVSGEVMTMPWQGGYSFYYANHPAATGRYFTQSKLAETSDPNPTHYLAIEGYRNSLSDADKAAFDRAPRYGAVNEFWFQSANAAIRSNPLAWARLMAQKGIYLFSDKEIFNYEEFDLQRDLSSILRWLPGRFGVVFPLAMASFATLTFVPFRRRRIHQLVFIYMVALSAGIALYFASGRMRMPLAFPLIALAGYSVAGFSHLKMPRKLVALVLLLAGVILSWGDWWGVLSESMAHVDLGRMSNAAWHKGDYRQALDFAVDAEKLSPNYPGLPRLKGQALYNLGRLDEARTEFQRSVDLLGDETSRRNLKVIDAEQAQ